MKRFLISLALLAGCATTGHVEPGTVLIGDALTVISDGGWNRLQGDPDAQASEAWTADGVTLDMVLFYAGNLPGWRPGMLPHDVVELYESLVAQDGGRFALERLAPARFGGVPGFLFEHTTRTRTGLALRGRAYGAVVEDRLFLLSYSAPAAYFYAKHLPRVEALAASAQIRRRESAAFASP